MIDITGIKTIVVHPQRAALSGQEAIMRLLLNVSPETQDAIIRDFSSRKLFLEPSKKGGK